MLQARYLHFGNRFNRFDVFIVAKNYLVGGLWELLSFIGTALSMQRRGAELVRLSVEGFLCPSACQAIKKMRDLNSSSCQIPPLSLYRPDCGSVCSCLRFYRITDRDTIHDAMRYHTMRCESISIGFWVLFCFFC